MDPQPKFGPSEISYNVVSLLRVYGVPLLMCMVVMFLQQFCGINAVLFYLKDIFIKAGSDMDPGLAAFIGTPVVVVVAPSVPSGT